METNQIAKKPGIEETIDTTIRKKSGIENVEHIYRKKSDKLNIRDSEPRGFNLLTNDDYKSSPVKSRDYNLLEKKSDKQRDINKEYFIFT